MANFGMPSLLLLLYGIHTHINLIVQFRQWFLLIIRQTALMKHSAKTSTSCEPVNIPCTSLSTCRDGRHFRLLPLPWRPERWPVQSARAGVATAAELLDSLTLRGGHEDGSIYRWVTLLEGAETLNIPYLCVLFCFLFVFCVLFCFVFTLVTVFFLFCFL